MRDRTALKPLTVVAVLMFALASLPFSARAQSANAAKARALVDAAIKMSDSDAAVKLLWQATDIAPAILHYAMAAASASLNGLCFSSARSSISA